MIEAPAAAPIAFVEGEDELAVEPLASRWGALADDLRFFLICYCAGLIAFLVMLS